MALFGLVSAACLTEHLSHEVCVDRTCIAVARRELHSVSIHGQEVLFAQGTRVINLEGHHHCGIESTRGYLEGHCQRFGFTIYQHCRRDLVGRR